MRVSLDTNIWIFGILGIDPLCEKILLHLSEFEIVIPNQIRVLDFGQTPSTHHLCVRVQSESLR